jgi:Protein kinase domain/WD domain, G-beta repeat
MSSTASPALPIGYRLGEYEIEAMLGQGGFGITYRAKDVRLGSLVAIKEYFPQTFASRAHDGSTIYPNTSATASDAENYRWGLMAFLEEAQALAKFKHPHIVRVLRFMEANRTAYLVMEYEEGEPLSAYLRQHGGYVDEPMLLGVFLPILTGLQAVHDAGLLHLDIKPDNIYLRANGQPMLIDFGSARQFRSGSDASRRVALSRGYAALEQYPDKGERGPWTDVYGVGASLYRCITGEEPVDSLKRQTTLAKKRIDPQVPASRFERPLYAKHIRESVDAATQLDAAARPQTARALQNGLMGKGLSDEAAAPFVPFGRGAGFIGVTPVREERRRRTRRGPLEALVAFLVLVGTAVVVTPKMMVDLGYLTPGELLQRADDWRASARDVGRIINERVFGVRERPVEAPPRPVLPRPARRQAPEPRKVVAFSGTPKVVREVRIAQPAVSLAFVGDGSRFANAMEDGTVQLRNAETGEWLRTFVSKTGTPGIVAASSDGRWLAMTAADHVIKLWDAETDRPPLMLSGNADVVTALAFAPDGDLLASAAADEKVLLWNVETGQRVVEPMTARAKVFALAFSPNGRVLSAADEAGGVQSWEVPSGAEMSYFLAAHDAVTALAYSADGKWMATGGRDHFLKLWSVGLGRKDRVFNATPETVEGLAFTPDRRWLLAVGSDETVRAWNLEDGGGTRFPHAPSHDVHALAFSADGSALATAGDDNTIRLWK